MDLAVFECTRTLELGRLARDEGFTVYVPTCLQRVPRKERVPGGVREYYELKRVVPDACRGYIYVAFSERFSFRRWVSDRYNARMLMTYAGRGVGFTVQNGVVTATGRSVADLPGPRRAEFMAPYRMDAKHLRAHDAELRRMSAEAKAAHEGLPVDEPAPEPRYEVGDMLVVRLGLLCSVEGKAVRFKADGTVVLDIRGKLVVVPKSNLRPKDHEV